MGNLIYVINASGLSGKDTFVDACSLYCNVRNVSTVDLVKKAAKILGWNGKKDDESRMALHELKILSEKYFNGPTVYITEEITRFIFSDQEDILFIHCREPYQIQKIVDRFGAKTIFIERDCFHIPNNPADQGVRDYEYDFYIDNNGTLDDLVITAKEFVESELGFCGELSERF